MAIHTPGTPVPSSLSEPPLDEVFGTPGTVSLQERRYRTLKHGDTFGVFDVSGDISGLDGDTEGLFHRDTRHLSRLLLLVEGVRPLLLSSDLRDDNAALTCDMANPDLVCAGDGQAVAHDLIHIRRSKFLWDEACWERYSVRSFADRPLRLRVEMRFGADFADLFEVRGRRRPRRGQQAEPELRPDGVAFRYDGLDGIVRTTRLRFDPPPTHLAPDRAVFVVELEPYGRRIAYVEVRCSSGATTPADVPGIAFGEGSTPVDAPDRSGAFAAAPPTPALAYMRSLRRARRALRTTTSRAVEIETSNQVFNEAVARSVADLGMLVTETRHGPYPYAGIPWFSTVFGRDALVTGLETLWADPAILRGVLRYLAANQADAVDPDADAEPGKILHEMRHGEMAVLGEVPFRKYYGSVDSTPLFVAAAGAYLDRTGDVATLRALWPHVERALAWLEQHGDRDGDGFVEYYRMTASGLANQGWKDSWDSIFHADGSLARGPIALCEVQAYAHWALLAASRIAAALDLPDRAAELARRAASLAARVDEAFWCEELGTYALALDGDKRPCRVRSSNAGQVLLSGLAPAGRAARVAAQLTGSGFMTGWGVRTVASGEARYNPMSYHNGSVWPHDNALIAMGFARYGFREEAAQVFEALFDCCVRMELRRLPELICGFPRRRGQGPVAYPVACVPQAWSAAAPLSLLQSCLGLGFDPARRTVTFDRPVLPAFLDSVTLRGLSVGDAARIDIKLRRRSSGVSMAVQDRAGDILATMTS